LSQIKPKTDRLINTPSIKEKEKIKNEGMKLAQM
jgi:hypothetical protein